MSSRKKSNQENEKVQHQEQKLARGKNTLWSKERGAKWPSAMQKKASMQRYGHEKQARKKSRELWYSEDVPSTKKWSRPKSKQIFSVEDDMVDKHVKFKSRGES